MKILLRPSSKLIALFLFLPITPSIAAIAVFTQSVLIDLDNSGSIIPHHTRRVIEASSSLIPSVEE